MIFIRYPRITV